ncbi:hypothetical protein PoB_002874900 [Plakobranchus ocellatus]|uniref:Uncharacterized protein n=1 Tax=Plakobranchus ocellatus TaxID=259542 RepID=A0AAV4A6R0_9GAST|nr:hypothetical protein PoB_002874900 [Plakobranchus ocellatus]
MTCLLLNDILVGSKERSNQWRRRDRGPSPAVGTRSSQPRQETSKKSTDEVVDSKKAEKAKSEERAKKENKGNATAEEEGSGESVHKKGKVKQAEEAKEDEVIEKIDGKS